MQYSGLDIVGCAEKLFLNPMEAPRLMGKRVPSAIENGYAIVIITGAIDLAGWRLCPRSLLALMPEMALSLMRCVLLKLSVRGRG